MRRSQCRCRRADLGQHHVVLGVAEVDLLVAESDVHVAAAAALPDSLLVARLDDLGGESLAATNVAWGGESGEGEEEGLDREVGDTAHGDCVLGQRMG